MQFIPACGDYTTQMKTLFEKSHCLPLSAFVCFFFSNQNLDLASHQTT
jgi:hypothetical protein